MNTKLENVRADLPAANQYAYLNTGTCGPLSRPVIDALAAAAHDQAILGRIRHEVNVAEERPRAHDLRAAFAKLMGVHTHEVALARNTTDGLNTAVWGQPWRLGDEIIVTDLEHEGGVMPAVLAGKKFGLNLKTLCLLDTDPTDIPNIIDDELGPNSKLLVISHVSWSNGALVPLKEVVAAAHGHSCRVAVDAAQSAGAVPLELHDTDVDYYAVPGQKWLCGPEGIGALYVKEEAQATLSPTYTGYSALPSDYPDHPWDCFGHLVLASDARRYENSSIYRPGVHGMLAGLEWLDITVGWDWAFAQMNHIHHYARERLMELPSLTVFTPEAAAGLLHFHLPEGTDVDYVNDALVAHAIRIRTIPHMNCLRVSTSFWNTEEEIERLAEALIKILH